MPSGNSFLFAALTGYLVVLTIQVIGLTQYIHFSKQFSGNKYYRWMWYGLFVVAQFPLVYWLLFYKSLAIDVPTFLWWSSWLVTSLIGVNLLIVGSFSAFRFIVSKVKKPTSKETPKYIQERRDFIRLSTYSGIGVITSSALLLTKDSPEPVIERITFSFPNLPHNFDGITIGMLSDIHSSPFMQKQQIELYKQTLMSLQCDMLVLPGDFINSRTEEVFACVEGLRDIHAPMGVWAVTGNHDYFSKQVETVVSELEYIGIRLLRNQNVKVYRGNESISLLGIDDEYSNSIGKYITDGFTYEKAVENMVASLTDSFKVLLCHRPYRFEDFSEIGIDCMLSGHTHGGQIVALPSIIPGGVSFSKFASPYVAGTYSSTKNKNAKMYVTRGVGSVGIPIRYNAKPEITKITLLRG